MSYILGEKPIEHEDLIKIADDLLPKDDQNYETNSKLLRRILALGPFIWKHGRKLINRRSNNVEINLDPSDIGLSNLYRNGDLDADILSEILENLNDD